MSKYENVFSMLGKHFCHVFDSLIGLTDKIEPSRLYAISGVLVEVKNGQVELTATDGMAIGTYYLPTKSNISNVRFVANGQVLQMVSKIVKSSTPNDIVYLDVKVVNQKHYLRLRIPKIGLGVDFVELEGRYPNYPIIFPVSSDEFIVKMNSVKLKRICQDFRKVRNNENNHVILNFDLKSLVVHASVTHDDLEIFEKIIEPSCVYSHELSIKLVPEKIINCIRYFKAKENVVIHYHGKEKPIKFSSESGDFSAVAMPLFWND